MRLHLSRVDSSDILSTMHADINRFGSFVGEDDHDSIDEDRSVSINSFDDELPYDAEVCR